jgi:phosphoribosylformylglycinamidine synthase subunit PurS
MYKVKILITLRKTILDPQGKAVEHSLKSLGYDKITDTRIGKYVELQVEADSRKEAAEIAENACKKLLANPVMEDYTYEITGGEK